MAKFNQESRKILRLTKGHVRWYDRDLQYGFIWEEGRTHDIFVHKNAIQVPGSRYLRQGQRVLFELSKIGNKRYARIVLPIKESPEKLERKRQKQTALAERQKQA